MCVEKYVYGQLCLMSYQFAVEIRNHIGSNVFTCDRDPCTWHNPIADALHAAYGSSHELLFSLPIGSLMPVDIQHDREATASSKRSVQVVPYLWCRRQRAHLQTCSNHCRDALRPSYDAYTWQQVDADCSCHCGAAEQWQVQLRAAVAI